MSSTTFNVGSPVPTVQSPVEYQNNSPVEGPSRNIFSRAKARKLAATGGGRAWTEEEEVYLLQTRLQKMPYKHIAAHLKKTELACRLHYHQLSHGSNRRKRTSSPTAGSPVGRTAMLPQQPTTPDPDDNSSITTTPKAQSPITENNGSPSKSNASTGNVKSGSTTPKRHCKPILPKPAGYTTSPPPSHARRDSDNSTTSNSSSPKQLPRLNCQSHHLPIDKDRLRRIYEAHRVDFWRFIASEYGGGVDPALLEETWRRGFSYTPPTPCVSPDNRTGAAVIAAVVSTPLAPSALPPTQHQQMVYQADPERERAFSSINRPEPPITLAQINTSGSPQTPSAVTSSMPSMAALLTESVTPHRSKEGRPSMNAATTPTLRQAPSMNDIMMRDAAS